MSIPAKRINFTHDDVLALLVDAIKKKHPELSEEEFEVSLTFDSYNNVYAASVEHLA